MIDMKYGKSRTASIYNHGLFDALRTDGIYDIPKIRREDVRPDFILPFNRTLSYHGNVSQMGIHFFIDDYQFERVWNNPYKYLSLFHRYGCVFTPDWSLYLDFPTALLVWNHYRKQLIGQFLQNEGIHVVPTLGWGFRESYKFCFLGLPTESTVAVAAPRKFHVYRNLWYKGMAEAIKRLQPIRILAYGEPVEFDAGGAEVVWFQSEHLKHMRTYNHKKGSTKQLGKGAQSPRSQFLVSHPGVVYEVAKRLQIPRNDWEDFYQEVILRCLQTPDQYDPHCGSLIGWSRRFAELVALNFRKQNKSKFLNFDDSCASSSFGMFGGRTRGGDGEDGEEES